MQFLWKHPLKQEIKELFQEICKKILESYKDLKEENPNDSKDSKEGAKKCCSCLS